LIHFYKRLIHAILNWQSLICLFHFTKRPWHWNALTRSCKILDETLLLSAQLDQLERICSTGRPLSWALLTHHIREEYSFSLFTFLRITHSNHPRCPLLRASTIQTSTPMARFVLTSWGRSGPQHWLLARCCYLSVLFSVIPILMTHWSPKLLGSLKLTGRSTTS